MKEVQEDGGNEEAEVPPEGGGNFCHHEIFSKDYYKSMFSPLEVVQWREGQEDGGHEEAEVPPEGGGHLRPQEGGQATELQGES